MSWATSHQVTLHMTHGIFMCCCFLRPIWHLLVGLGVVLEQLELVVGVPALLDVDGAEDDGVEVRAWVRIHGCRNCIYDCKIYDSVVELLMKLAQFWYFGHVSKSLVAKSTTAMNPNPGPFEM